MRWLKYLYSKYKFLLEYSFPNWQSLPRYAVVAEWLRRQTRNLMGSPRAGSNPAGCVQFLWAGTHLINEGDVMCLANWDAMCARVAQWIRRRSPKPKIAGSNPAVGNDPFCHLDGGENP